jgi:hypothetical protein
MVTFHSHMEYYLALKKAATRPELDDIALVD